MTIMLTYLLPPTIFGKGQTVEYLELSSLGIARRGVHDKEPHRVRIKIKADSHREQGFALIELWDGFRWEELWSIPGQAMATDPELGYAKRPPTSDDFREDRGALLTAARAVLDSE